MSQSLSLSKQSRQLSHRIDHQVGHYSRGCSDLFPIFPSLDQNSGHTGVLSAFDIIKQVISDHGDSVSGIAEVIQRQPEEFRRGLSNNSCFPAGGIFQPRDEGADIHPESIRYLPVAAFVQGDNARAAHDHVEQAVHQVIIPTAADIANYHDVWIPIVFSEFREFP